MIQNPKPHRGLQIAVAVGAAAALVLLSLGVPGGGCGGPPAQGPAAVGTKRQAQIIGANLGPNECGSCWVGAYSSHYEICSSGVDDPTAQDNGPCPLPGETASAASGPVPGNRLFVHGFLGDSTSWQVWRTIADNANAGTSYVTVAPDDHGSKSLLEQASNLADSINAGFAGQPDNSVTVYAHSMGVPKVEAILELGWYQSDPSRISDLDGNSIAGLQNRIENILSGHDFAGAARKIKRLEAFQGAHGGCSADILVPTVIGAVGPLRAARDLGYLETNSDPWYWGTNDIPGTRWGYMNTAIYTMGTSNSGLLWDMEKIVWSDSNAPKTIRFNRGFVHSGGTQCDGALSGPLNMTALVCSNANENDGTVRKESMAPTWWANYGAVAAHVSINDLSADYCHMVPFAGTAPYIDPKKDTALATAMLSEGPPPAAPSGHRFLISVPGGNYCDVVCFCAMQPGSPYCQSSTGGGSPPDDGNGTAELQPEKFEKVCQPTVDNQFCGTLADADHCLCVAPRARPTFPPNLTDPGYLACRAWARTTPACFVSFTATPREIVRGDPEKMQAEETDPKVDAELAERRARETEKAFAAEPLCQPSIDNKFCESMTDRCTCATPSDSYPECLAFVAQQKECREAVGAMFRPKDAEPSEK